MEGFIKEQACKLQRCLNLKLPIAITARFWIWRNQVHLRTVTIMMVMMMVMMVVIMVVIINRLEQDLQLNPVPYSLTLSIGITGLYLYAFRCSSIDCTTLDLSPIQNVIFDQYHLFSFFTQNSLSGLLL